MNFKFADFGLAEVMKDFGEGEISKTAGLSACKEFRLGNMFLLRIFVKELNLGSNDLQVF